MKTIHMLIALVVLIVLAVVIALAAPVRTAAPVVVETPTEEIPTEVETPTYESVTFTGELEAIDQRCAMDMQCSITVDGEVIQTSPGFVTQEYMESLGAFDGSADISEIMALVDTDQLQESETPWVYEPVESIMVEAYVRLHDDGMYSVYGSNDYYIRIIQ